MINRRWSLGVSLRSADGRKLVHKRKCMELKLFLPGSPGGSKKKKKMFLTRLDYKNKVKNAAQLIVCFHPSCSLYVPRT